MNPCYLGIGSNQKNPERQIHRALKALRQLPSSALLKVSNLYWNPAWGNVIQQDFCNVVVELHTSLNPLKLLNYCKAIEKKQGRLRKKKWGPRTLDIDIILYSNRIINTPQLRIPHPYMQQRNFVLIPLLEINPKLAKLYTLV